MQDLISVIIPAYNIEQWIGRCLDSLINQSYSNIQIIVVNDGSTDSTGAVIEFYQNKDSRINVIHQRNQGVSAARNTGLRDVKGAYICFVDGDDWVARDYIENLYSCFAKSETQLAICGFVEEDENGKQIHLRNNHAQTKKTEEILEQLFFTEEIGRSLWNKMFVRETIEVNNLRFSSQYQVGEDMLFLIKYLLCIKNVQIAEGIGYHYLWRAGSAMNKRQWDERYDRSRRSWLEALTEVERLLKNQSPRCKKNLQTYRQLVQYRILCESVSLSGNDQNKIKLERTLLKKVRRHGLAMLYSNQLPPKTKIGVLLCCVSPRLQVRIAQMRK